MAASSAMRARVGGGTHQSSGAPTPWRSAWPRPTAARPACEPRQARGARRDLCPGGLGLLVPATDDVGCYVHAALLRPQRWWAPRHQPPAPAEILSGPAAQRRGLPCSTTCSAGPLRLTPSPGGSSRWAAAARCCCRTARKAAAGTARVSGARGGGGFSLRSDQRESTAGRVDHPGRSKMAIDRTGSWVAESFSSASQPVARHWSPERSWCHARPEAPACRRASGIAGRRAGRPGHKAQATTGRPTAGPPESPANAWRPRRCFPAGAALDAMRTTHPPATFCGSMSFLDERQSWHTMGASNAR